MDNTPQKEIHPEDLRLFRKALDNRYTLRQLYHFIVPGIPIFLYCPLMLPWVLATVLDVPDPKAAGADKMAQLMTRAILCKHVRKCIRHTHRPTLERTRNPKDMVEGILFVGGVENAIKAMEDYIGIDDHSQDVREVEVVLADGGTRLVAAYVYVWTGRKSLIESNYWDPTEYMRYVTSDER